MDDDCVETEMGLGQNRHETKYFVDTVPRSKGKIRDNSRVGKSEEPKDSIGHPSDTKDLNKRKAEAGKSAVRKYTSELPESFRNQKHPVAQPRTRYSCCASQPIWKPGGTVKVSSAKDVSPVKPKLRPITSMSTKKLETPRYFATFYLLYGSVRTTKSREVA